MFTRKVLTTVGFLNESYGVGLGDDDDYCRRAQEAGFELVLAQRLRVHHAHRTTFKTLYTPQQLAAMQHKALYKFHAEGGQFVRRVQEYERDQTLLMCGHTVGITTARDVVCPNCILEFMERRSR
jgi:GT2 family glycosyltransferase